MDYIREDSNLYKLFADQKMRKIPKGQVVDGFGESNMFHLLKSGFIKRYLIAKDGTQSIQVIYGPNDAFPMTSVYKKVFNMDIYSGPNEYYYEAMTPLEAYSMSHADLLKALEQNPKIYKDLYFASGLRLNSYIHRLESMSLGVANKKIAHQLLYLANTFGEDVEGGTKITLPLTHQTIGEILNLARETVTNRITRLTTLEVIRAEGGHIIVDKDKLAELSK